MRNSEELVCHFASINSFSHNREGLEKMARALQAEIKKLQPDQLKVIPLENGPALFAEKRAAAKRQVYLGGHFDTVHPNLWPVEKRGARLYGPGVCDMKGGLTVLLKSLERFEACDEREGLGWRLFFNPDEEIGSRYSAPLIRKFAKGCCCALIFEPTLPNHHLVSGRRGSVNFLCEAFGKAAHAGRDRQLGECAITKLAHFIVGIEKLSRQTAYATVGKMEGGIAGNVVADFASCLLNFRFDKDYPKERLTKLSKECGVKLKKVNERPPKPFEKKTKALFKSLQKEAQLLGYSLDWEKTGGVCDGNETHHAGTPTIDTMGVEGGKIHTKEEFLLIKSLEKKQQLTLAFLKSLAQGEFDATNR